MRMLPRAVANSFADISDGSLASLSVPEVMSDALCVCEAFALVSGSKLPVCQRSSDDAIGLPPPQESVPEMSASPLKSSVVALTSNSEPDTETHGDDPRLFEAPMAKVLPFWFPKQTDPPSVFASMDAFTVDPTRST